MPDNQNYEFHRIQLCATLFSMTCNCYFCHASRNAFLSLSSGNGSVLDRLGCSCPEQLVGYSYSQTRQCFPQACNHREASRIEMYFNAVSCRLVKQPRRILIMKAPLPSGASTKNSAKLSGRAYLGSRTAFFSSPRLPVPQAPNLTLGRRSFPSNHNCGVNFLSFKRHLHASPCPAHPLLGRARDVSISTFIITAQL